MDIEYQVNNPVDINVDKENLMSYIKDKLNLLTVVCFLFIMQVHSGYASGDDLFNQLGTSDPAAFGPGKGVTGIARVQDSLVTIPNEQVFLKRSDVSKGPTDSQLIYADSERSAELKNGTFACGPLYGDRLTEADSVSVYLNLRVGMDLFQSDLRSLLEQYAGDAKLKRAASNYNTNTKTKPLFYFVKGKEMENAYYSRSLVGGTEYRVMVLGYYLNRGRYEYTAQQPDIIWHELGHSLVDAAREDLFSGSPVAGAFHEAWGDTNAMFTLLKRPGVKEKVLYDVRGDLHQRNNFLSQVAEKFGRSVMKSGNGLRNLDDDVKDGATMEEVHDKSRVLAGAVYDTMVKAYEDLARRFGYAPVDALANASDYLRTSWVYTLTQIDSSPSFTEIGTIWKNSLPQGDEKSGFGLPWKSYVDQTFNARGIVLDGTPDPWDWNSVHGVVQRCSLVGEEHDEIVGDLHARLQNGSL